MSIRTTDLAVFDELSIVKIRGFDPGKQAQAEMVDPPGLANWLVEQYGFQPQDSQDPELPGILWTDYDQGCDDPWAFSVLIAHDEVESISRLADTNGYYIIATRVVTEPVVYGDGSGTCLILRHPDGWVIAS